MNKLAKIINDLGYEELKLIQKDLNEGHIEQLIDTRLKQFDEGKGVVCPICGANIMDLENNTLTLFFGPKDFRRKATFDATDCLEYFIEHLKTMNNKKIRKGEETNATFRDYADT